LTKINFTCIIEQKNKQKKIQISYVYRQIVQNELKNFENIISIENDKINIW